MASSLFPQSNNGNPMLNMLNQFNQFRQQMEGRDPQKMIDELISSGRMSMQQYEQLQQQAKQLAQFLK